MPRRLLLTAGGTAAVRQQLGLSDREQVRPLDAEDLPLTPGLRRQLRQWADTFVDLHLAGGIDDGASRSWAELGIAVASALADELAPEVEMRYLAHSVAAPAAGHAVAEPIAGLFEDVLLLPVVPVQNGWTAFRSTLNLAFGGGAGPEGTPPEPWRTAARTDATDAELGELRRRAVDPVVRSLLTPDELASARVVVYQEDGTPEISLWLAVAGEEMRHWLWHPEYSRHLPDPVDIAADLADSMEDWVCETRFAWGQRRMAVYQIPPSR